MAVVYFMDGFDYYASNQIPSVWTTGAYAGNGYSIQTGRNGVGKCLQCASYMAQVGVLNKGLPSNIQTFCWGFGFLVSSIASDTRLPKFLLYDGTTVQLSFIMNLDRTISIYRGDKTTLLGTSPVFCALSEWATLEFDVYIHDTAGYVNIHKNGNSTPFYSVTNADTKAGTNAYVNKIGVVPLGTYTGTTFKVDDMYVADSRLGNVKVETLFPSGAGATTQWTPLSGANYENVDENPSDGDTSYVSTATTGQIDTYAFGDLASTTGVIAAVKVNVVAKIDVAGACEIAPVLRPASTDRLGNAITPSTNYAWYNQIFNINPEDSQAWEIADVNGSEFGIKRTS